MVFHFIPRVISNLAILLVRFLDDLYILPEKEVIVLFLKDSISSTKRVLLLDLLFQVFLFH
jgi:hypothetical protein